jgi:hypothetical protein
LEESVEKSVEIPVLRALLCNMLEGSVCTCATVCRGELAAVEPEFLRDASDGEGLEPRTIAGSSLDRNREVISEGEVCTDVMEVRVRLSWVRLDVVW